MCAVHEVELHIVGKYVGNNEDIMASDALSDGELAFTCLESYEFCVENIVVTCITRIICILVIGS